MSLDMIERFLKHYGQNGTWFKEGHRTATTRPSERWSWESGRDFYRLDGSIAADQRKKMQDRFNDPRNGRARVFLISTRAGSLGIDLIGANRVVIFDCCWNPSHDTQSIFRVYRFGQLKPCYIYRLVSQGAMEEVVYRRQVTKMSVQLRVVDAAQIARHYAANDLEQLYSFQPESIPSGDERRDHIRQFTPPVCLVHFLRLTKALLRKIKKEDMMLRELLMDKGEWISRIQEHDSLLVHQESETLSKEEREEAWADYEKEQQQGVAISGTVMYDEPVWFPMVSGTLYAQYGLAVANEFKTVCKNWLAYGQHYLQFLSTEERRGITDLNIEFLGILQRDVGTINKDSARMENRIDEHNLN